MSPKVKYVLQCAGTMAAVLVSVVLLLGVANAFMKPPAPPAPKLDLETVQILNEMAPTGVDDQSALDYFKLTGPETVEDLAAWNALHGYSGAQFDGFARYKLLLAVYEATEGPHKGMIFVMTRTEGYYNGYVDIMTAIRPNGAFWRMRLLNDAIYAEDDFAADDMGKINTALFGRPINDIILNDFKSQLTIGDPFRAGATVTGAIFTNALELAAKIFAEVTA